MYRVSLYLNISEHKKVAPALKSKADRSALTSKDSGSLVT